MCEQDGASWLPFEHLRPARNSIGNIASGDRHRGLSQRRSSWTCGRAPAGVRSIKRCPTWGSAEPIRAWLDTLGYHLHAYFDGETGALIVLSTGTQDGDAYERAAGELNRRGYDLKD